VAIDPLASVRANEQIEPSEAENEAGLRGDTARLFLDLKSSTQDNAKAVRPSTLGTLSASSHKAPAPLVRKLYEYVNVAMRLEALHTYEISQ
jgi:hypothetical protein